MAGQQQHLISRDIPYCSSVPVTQRGTAHMERCGGGFVNAAVSKRRTTKSKVHIFQIRLERFIQPSYRAKAASADEDGGEGREVEGTGRAPIRSVGPARPTSQRAAATGNGIERAVETGWVGGHNSLTAHKSDVLIG